MNASHDALSGVADNPEGSALASRSRLELIPLPSVRSKFAELRPGSRLSVTCSPAQGIGATLAMTAELRGLGHDAIPHIAARQVQSVNEVRHIAQWCADQGVREVFVVGGDANPPAGPYDSALALARDVAQFHDGLETVGFTAYPDGHADIPEDVLSRALADKQQFLEGAGLSGYVSTQMCFSDELILAWLGRVRAQGFWLPVRIGVPGPVDKLKLIRISTRLGVGNSLRFLKKNRSSIVKLMSSTHFDPGDVADKLIGSAGQDLGVVGLHVFSFNNVAPSVEWFESYTRTH